MTPDEREKFDLEIYLQTKEATNRGCITDAADYLRHKKSDRVSRLVNPYDSRANTIFGEAMDLLEAFNHKHPALAEFIWQKMVLQARSFMETGEQIVKLAEFAEIADVAVREQMDVNSAVLLKKSVPVIQQEAFEAFEKSRIQYEKAMQLGNVDGLEVIQREQ